MRRLVLVLVLAIAAAACGSPEGSQPPAGFALRMWTSQAVPPDDGFATRSPSVVILDGHIVSHGPVAASFPGPLLPHLVARPITEAGIGEVLGLARRAGLLDGPTDLTGGIAPGGLVGHLRIALDGAEREVLGDPTRQIMCIQAPCEAPPATPEAFAGFWSSMVGPEWLGPELGPERPYRIERLAALVTDPLQDPALPPTFAAWPLAGAIAEFGSPVGNGDRRCGLIEGEELEPALAAFAAGNQLTQWRDGGERTYGLVLRPVFPGEADPCVAQGAA